jgi:hypothetical protein
LCRPVSGPANTCNPQSSPSAISITYLCTDEDIQLSEFQINASELLTVATKFTVQKLKICMAAKVIKHITA